MTFQEAVEKMAKHEDLGFRTVEYEVAFHNPIPSRNCKLYASALGGIIVNEASTWDEAFEKFDALIVARTPSKVGADDGQAPTEDTIQPPAPLSFEKEEKDGLPF